MGSNTIIQKVQKSLKKYLPIFSELDILFCPFSKILTNYIKFF